MVEMQLIDGFSCILQLKQRNALYLSVLLSMFFFLLHEEH